MSELTEKKTNQLTEGPLLKALISFTIPFLLSNLLQTLYGTVDTLVVGNLGSTAGVSAVATGAQALSLLTFMAIGVASGSTVLLGQYVGAKNDKDAAKVVGNTIIDFAVISVVLTGIMLVIYPFLLNMLNIPEEARSEANRYMVICSFGIPMIIGYNTVCALLRAIGDSKSPLVFVGVACGVNIIGDLLLTGWLKMGAAGVAIATVGAQTVSFIFSLVFIMKKGLPFAFSKKDIRFEGSMTGKIMKIGIPMGIQSMLINLSFLFITSIINSMGVTASAAMGIGDKIIGFAFMPQGAFSAASSVVVAQNIGANNPKRAMDAVKYSVLICLVIEVLFFIVCQIWPAFFPSLFSKDVEVVAKASDYMKAYSIDAVITAITFSLSGYLNGCGRTMFNMAQNLISTFLGRIPATYVMARIPNTTLFLLGLAAPISSLMSLVMLLVYIIMMNRSRTSRA